MLSHQFQKSMGLKDVFLVAGLDGTGLGLILHHEALGRC